MIEQPDDCTEMIFAYGTLRDVDTQIAVFGRSTDGTPDALDGYRLDSINLDGAVYPIAHPDTNGIINGLRYPVTQSELDLIDAYEGNEYRRIRVRLRSGEDTWVYVANHA